MLLVLLLNECIGSFYCICNNQYQNSIFQPSQNFCIEMFSSCPSMAVPLVDSGQERTSNT